MKTVRLHGLHDLRQHDEPMPQAGLHEALVRVTAVGICGSDLHWFSDGGIGDARLAKPLIIGHEFAGLTASGQRVAVDPAVPCHACQFCQEGNPNLCENLRFAGHGVEDGALREAMAWPEECLFPLPDSLSDADGVMLEPLGVAIHAVDLAHLRLGMSVGVFGCGPIGLLILQLARLSGAANIITTDILPHRLEAARALGAQHAFLAQAGPEIQKAAGKGVDVAFEAAGDNQAVEAAMAAVKPGGCLILVGIPGDDRTSFPASLARRKGLTIKLVRRMKFTYPRAIHMVQSGLVDVRSLVTHQFPLKQCMQAFTAAQQREGLKVMIIP